MSPPVDRPWRPKARDFAQFQAAIEEELRTKPDNSEWVVELEVKKRGNPIHDYRIVLRPR
jgi:hypothetical protein